MKHDKVIDKILRGTSDANMPFEDIRRMLLYLGFDERVRGSHHISKGRGCGKNKLAALREQGQTISSKASPRGVAEISLGR